MLLAKVTYKYEYRAMEGKWLIHKMKKSKMLEIQDQGKETIKQHIRSGAFVSEICVS